MCNKDCKIRTDNEFDEELIKRLSVKQRKFDEEKSIEDFDKLMEYHNRQGKHYIALSEAGKLKNNSITELLQNADKIYDWLTKTQP